MNKLGTKLGAVAMSAVMALSFAPSAAITSLAAGDGLTDPIADSYQTVYVCYDANSGEHLWTTEKAEADWLVNEQGWLEGNPAWKAPSIAGEPVYRLYSPSTGEHHYTANKNEATWLEGLGWNNEKVAFLTPDPEDDGATPILCYRNPNGGRGAHQYTISEEEAEFLDGIGWGEEDPRFYGYELTFDPVVEELTVSIDNTTPKVGDTIRVLIHDEDGNEVNPADVDAEIQWYADGVAITGATDAEYDVLSMDEGVVLSVIVTIDDEEYTDDTAVVAKGKSEEEIATEIEISDISGLQSNGTGLRNDTLELSYGSEVGTPVSITWYRDSKILATYTDKASSYSYDNGLRIGVAANSARDFVPAMDYTNKIGKYWAVIKTADGDEFKSSTIEITDKEERAVIKNFSIEDDYEQNISSTEGAESITYSANDTTAVATLTLNRAYGGEIYLYKKSDTTFTTAIGHTGSQMDTGKNATAEGFTAVTQRELVAKNASKMYKPGANLNEGIKYIADDGEATYMWTIGTTAVVRGEEYVLVFDQTNVEDDAIGEKNENVSKPATAPYLTAPASIAVTKRVPGAPAVVTAYGADGKALAWFGNTAAGSAAIADNIAEVGLESVDVYEEVGNAKAKASKKSMTGATATVVKGVITGAGTDTLSATGYNYFWAELKTASGIFGSSAITLESPVVEAPAPVASLVKISMKKGTPTTAEVALENVAAPATVYIIDAATWNNGAASDTTVSVQAGQRLVHVEKGDTKAEIANGFSKTDGAMWAVVVPDDTENFTRIANGSGTTLGAAAAYNVGASKAITSFAVKDKTTAAGGLIATGLTAKDQFGDTIATTGLDMGAQPMTRASSAPAASISATAATATIVAGTTPGSGDVSVTIGITGTGIAGDIWYVRIAEGQFLVAKCKTGGATGACVWELSLAATAP